MEKVVLKATKRDVIGKQVNALRRSGRLPAVIYGRHTEPVNITLDSHDASLALSKVGSSTLISIDVDGTEYPALVRERQRDYIKDRLIHVDFLAVSLTEKIRAEVRIELTGLSLAVKDFDAVLVTGLHTLSVECLPADLPEHVVVDISPLAKVGDSIHVRDITLGDKVEVEAAPAAEVAAAAPEAEAAEPELSVERGKKEEEQAAEEKKK